MSENKLYLVATPIGNLGDMSQRALEVLNSVDFVAAEDTRNTLKLFNKFDIKKPMVSYFEHNKRERGEYIVSRIEAGEDCALVTDAGTPAISDPGEVLVRECQKANITVTSLPGACALITALTLSGLNTRRFCMEGFLPADKKEKKDILEELKCESRTMILYEAPHRLNKTLAELYEVLGDREIALCRELTKKFETVFKTTLKEAIAYYEENEPRGEYVLVIEGKSREEKKQEMREEWEKMSIEEHVAFYEKQGIDHKESMKKVAKDRGISKRDVYQKLL